MRLLATRRQVLTRVAWIVVCIVLLAGALLLIPIPYFIFGPGAAVNLNDAIVVPGHSPPPGRFYLTDVNLLPGRPAFYVAAKTLPGYEIVKRRELVPPHMSDRDLDTALVDAMRESQTNAQIVAERAAGLPVKVASSFVVVSTAPHSPGARCFQAGDKIVNVNGSDLHSATALATMTTAQPPGTVFRLALVRHGQRMIVKCRTFVYLGKARFGVRGSFQTEAYYLPVHVQYRLPKINGSSAGLMFALQIYRTLTGRDISGGRDVAGTGVLAVDGSVEPIEGAREKIEAALRAHAAVFLVPVKNYNDVRGVTGIRVIRVQSFADALRALQWSQSRPVSALI